MEVLENRMGPLKMLKIELLYDLAISLLGSYPSELKRESQNVSVLLCFAAALFTRDKI